MNVLVVTSKYGYSIHDQNVDISKLEDTKKRYEELQDQVSLCNSDRCKFLIIPSGVFPLIPGKSFLQSLQKFCPDFTCLENKVRKFNRNQ